MKRVLAVALATVLVGSALAQGTFTIRRPADGARVREVVDVRIPRGSIPEGGYLGIVVNGRFLEAVMPEVQGDDYVYKLDTKARGIEDGPLTIETILYMYSNNNPVVLNRSSVNVNLDNKTSIQIPDDGFNLRYRFVPGAEHTYSLKIASSISTISQAQAQLGSRGREVVLDEEEIRVLWAVDNVYNTPSGREGLVRIQLLPDEKKGYTWATPIGETQPRLIFADQMMSIYHRLSPVGREQFSSLPPYFPMEGTSGTRRSPIDWYLAYPFPVLPTRSIVPGGVWQAGMHVGDIPDPDNVQSASDKYFRMIPGRGVFEGVEWHNGIPCAKLSMNIQVGAEDLRGAQNLNSIQGETQSMQMQQVVWFALDRGIIVRQELNQVIEALVEVQSAGSGGGPGAQGGGRQGGPSVGTAGGGGSSSSATAGFIFSNLTPSTALEAANQLRLQVPPGGPGGPPGSGPQGGPPGGPQGGAGDGGFGRGPSGGGGSVGVKMILRVTSRIVIDLIK